MDAQAAPRVRGLTPPAAKLSKRVTDRLSPARSCEVFAGLGPVCVNFAFQEVGGRRPSSPPSCSGSQEGPSGFSGGRGEPQCSVRVPGGRLHAFIPASVNIRGTLGKLAHRPVASGQWSLPYVVPGSDRCCGGASLVSRDPQRGDPPCRSPSPGLAIGKAQLARSRLGTQGTLRFLSAVVTRGVCSVRVPYLCYVLIKDWPVKIPSLQ